MLADKCFPLFFLILLLHRASGQHSATISSHKPNIVVFLADDLGYGDIGPFGNRTIPTPHLDRLARDGFTLTHHLTAASLCTPSRAALLTGRYPVRYGMTSDWITRVFMFAASSGGLPNQEVTFARLLKRHGYATALIGKWHLGSQCPSPPDNCALPAGHGFDHFYGLPLTNLKDFGRDGASVFLSFFPHFRPVLVSLCFACLVALCLLHRLFQRPARRSNDGKSFELVAQQTNEVSDVDQPHSVDQNRVDPQSSNSETGSKTLKNLFRRQRVGGEQVWSDCSVFRLVIGLTLATVLGSSVFALVFQLNMTRLNSILMRNLQVVEQPVHMESLTRRLLNDSIEFMRTSAQTGQPFLLLLAFSKVHTAHFPSKAFAGKSTHGAYGDCVMELDWAVGQVLHELERLQQQDNTFVYFTSDNGAHLEELDAHGRPQGGYNGPLPGGKGQGAMEGGIRVPAIIRFLSLQRQNDSFASQRPKIITTATSQLDLMATILELVGQPNFEAILDGRSLLPLLRHTWTKQPASGRFFLHYCGYYLHAVRYARDDRHVYKLFYFKPRFRSNFRCKFVCRCYGPHVQRLQPPELYNVAQDVEERIQLNVGHNVPQIDHILALIEEQVRRHEQSLRPLPPSQLTLWHTVWKPHLQPCCNFPFCSCVER